MFLFLFVSISKFTKLKLYCYYNIIIKQNTVAIMDTRTDINGLPAKYVLTKNPNDPSGETCVVVKVLDVSETTHAHAHAHADAHAHAHADADAHENQIRVPSSYISYNFSETPLHLCDPANLITQYRRGDHNLAHRTIDISKKTHNEAEMKWYADPESKIPEPKRLVMICMLRCYLCGDYEKTVDDIYSECVDEHTFGYRYCTECRPYFLESLYKSIIPIMKFRREYEAWVASSDNTLPKPFIWVARTRRDENRRRIVGGNSPYRYTKWRILTWVARKHEFPRISPIDNETVIIEEEDSLVCEQIELVDGVDVAEFDYATITKLVPLRDIYITNLVLLADRVNNADTDTEYDPNNDDPLNKYSDKEQRAMFKAAYTQ